MPAGDFAWSLKQILEGINRLQEIEWVIEKFHVVVDSKDRYIQIHLRGAKAKGIPATKEQD